MSTEIKIFKPKLGSSNEVAITCAKYGFSSQQHGAALVMAMVVLLILTIIGVSALNVTSLEAKMANNLQDTNRAFEAAESGLNKAMNTAGSFDLFTPQTNQFSFGTSSKAVIETTFLNFSAPKRNSGYSSINYDSANFDQKSTGTGGAGGKSVVHQGASQIVNKAQ